LVKKHAGRVASNGAPVAHGLRQRTAVDVFQFAADRHTARQAGDFKAARLQQLADGVRGGFALGVKLVASNTSSNDTVQRPGNQPSR